MYPNTLLNHKIQCRSIVRSLGRAYAALQQSTPPCGNLVMIVNLTLKAVERNRTEHILREPFEMDNVYKDVPHSASPSPFSSKILPFQARFSLSLAALCYILGHHEFHHLSHPLLCFSCTCPSIGHLTLVRPQCCTRTSLPTPMLTYTPQRVFNSRLDRVVKAAVAAQES